MKSWGTGRLFRIGITAAIVFACAFIFGIGSQAASVDEEEWGITSVMGAVLDKGNVQETEGGFDVEVPDSVVAGTQLETPVEGNTGFVVEEMRSVDIGELCEIAVQPKGYVYSGQYLEPTVTVVYKDLATGQMKMLIQDKDFLVEYENNKNAGTGLVTVTGIGQYTGVKTAEFSIRQKSIENCSLLIDDKAVYADGKEKKPAVTVFYKGVPLAQNTDYKVTYSDNVGVGTANVSVQGIGNWCGSISGTFTIKYNAVKDLSYVPTKGMISLTWGKVAGAEGYEVFRSTSLENGYVKLADVKTNTYTDGSVSFDTTYFYKIRAYGLIEEERKEGAFSAPLKVSSESQVASLITPYEGVKYVYGGSSSKGWDCSGFTQWIMKNKFGVDIPRTSRDQAKIGAKVNMNNQAEWLPGDLIFFSKGGRVCHVALYIGDGKMMHASSTYKKTVIVDVDDYNRRCIANKMSGVRRVL